MIFPELNYDLVYNKYHAKKTYAVSDNFCNFAQIYIFWKRINNTRKKW